MRAIGCASKATVSIAMYKRITHIHKQANIRDIHNILNVLNKASPINDINHVYLVRTHQFIRERAVYIYILIFQRLRSYLFTIYNTNNVAQKLYNSNNGQTIAIIQNELLYMDSMRFGDHFDYL